MSHYGSTKIGWKIIARNDLGVVATASKMSFKPSFHTRFRTAMETQIDSIKSIFADMTAPCALAGIVAPGEHILSD